MVVWCSLWSFLGVLWWFVVVYGRFLVFCGFLWTFVVVCGCLLIVCDGFCLFVGGLLSFVFVSGRCLF